MQIRNTEIFEVKVIEPKLFEDERGFFFESYNARQFRELVTSTSFVQDNQSKSRKGVLRGLHFQLPPHAQGKLVRCLSGSIYDVAVDIRRSSPTFGKWVGIELSAENKKQLWIPEGFAHGFVVLSSSAEVLYKTNDYWHKECEGSIRWNDPVLNIKWPLEESPCLSEKDANAPFFKDAVFFD